VPARALSINDFDDDEVYTFDWVVSAQRITYCVTVQCDVDNANNDRCYYK